VELAKKRKVLYSEQVGEEVADKCISIEFGWFGQVVFGVENVEDSF
jgi:hypothetical protein